jgi:pyrroloquinoline quinone biosynthesis protein B
MVDATPDFPAQYHQLLDAAPGCVVRGIFLTHAHIGHYTGLMYLGKEAMNTRGLPVYTTHRMREFLSANAPWRMLVELGNIQLMMMQDQAAIPLARGLTVVPIAVPHRGEFSDTMAFRVVGKNHNLLYCPDIDRWGDFPGGAVQLLRGVDIALVDGTFFSAGELKGRDMEEVPHPLVKTSVEELRGSGASTWFIHLNHTNPLWREGAEREWLRQEGFYVGVEGMSWEL